MHKLTNYKSSSSTNGALTLSTAPAPKLSNFEKSYKEMKEQAKLNENVDHNMPYVQIPRTEQHQHHHVNEDQTNNNNNNNNSKKQLPLAESDPKKFAQLLTEKLEKLQLNNNSCHHDSNDSKFKKYFDYIKSSFKETNGCSNAAVNALECVNNEATALDIQDSDVEAERMIDEHVNRVFKTANLNAVAPAPPSATVVANNSPPKSHKKSHQNHNKSTNELQTTLNNTCGSYLSMTATSMIAANTTANASNTTLMATTAAFMNGSGSNQFYASQVATKEVDIDDNTYRHNHGHGHGHSHRNNEHNYDSGVSMRSVASIERVSDWLATSSYNAQQQQQQQQQTQAPQIPAAHVPQAPVQSSVTSNGVKTTVAYYLPGEEVAYISTFNGVTLTLAQFKQLITKKGHFR